MDTYSRRSSMSDSGGLPRPNEMGVESGTIAVAKAAAVVKSPILTRLEKAVFDRLVETGDDAKVGLENDDHLHSILLQAAEEELRKDRIQEKLELDPKWLKKQFTKMKASMNGGKSE